LVCVPKSAGHGVALFGNSWWW